jgi:hypothetical protein
MAGNAKRPSDLIDRIPDPETVRRWLAESVRRSDLLRSLLRLARRKAAHRMPTNSLSHGGEECLR